MNRSETSNGVLFFFFPLLASVVLPTGPHPPLRLARENPNRGSRRMSPPAVPACEVFYHEQASALPTLVNIVWPGAAGCDRVGGRHITFRSTTIRSTYRLGWSIPLDTQCPRGYVELKPTPHDTRTVRTCSRPPASQTTQVFVQHGVSSSRLSWATFPRSV